MHVVWSSREDLAARDVWSCGAKGYSDAFQTWLCVQCNEPRGAVGWFARISLSAAPDCEITIDEVAARSAELRNIMITMCDRAKCIELLRAADDILVRVLVCVITHIDQFMCPDVGEILRRQRTVERPAD